MRLHPRNPLASLTLALLVGSAGATLASPEAAHLDFAGAKAKAAETGKLVLIDFSSPT